MTNSIIPLLLDLMADTISVQAGSSSGTHGDWVPDASLPLILKCYIDGKKLTTVSSAGKEQISAVEVIIGSVNGLTTDAHRYTLPGRYKQVNDIEAISAEPVQDDNGVDYEVVTLPMQ